MSGQTVLVTGASGFTGSRLCRYLVQRGDTVRALVRPSSSLDALDGVDVAVFRGDLAAEDGIPAAALRGVETVYHIAALFRQEGATKDVFLATNADGTERLLRAGLKADIGRFVHCSTVGVHGHIENPPGTETTPFGPGDWYQESKLEGERRALAFHRETGLPLAVVRPAPIYGPGDTRFLKLFRAIKNGTFWMIGDGRPLYHLVYIDDLAAGFVLAAATDAAVGEVFIIAGPECVSVRELATRIGESVGRPVSRRHIPLAPVMLAARVCKAVCHPLGIDPPLYPRRLDFFRKDRAFDYGKATRLLGYRPNVDLNTGLQRTAEWYRQQGYL